MQNLKFNGEITLEEIFDNHRALIYDYILSSIQSSYLDTSKSITEIIKITINNDEYKINLTRDKFVSSLNRAISYYEETEEYEKCGECLKIINYLTQNKMEN